MPRRTKVIIAILSSVFILCICCSGFGLWGGWLASRAFVSETTEVKELGAEIADYTLPPGYSEIVGIRLLGSAMIAVSRDQARPDDMLIMLMSSPGGADVDQTLLEKQLATALQQQFSFQGLDLTLDRIETHTINGEEVALTYRKGEDAFGTPYRQMSALFNSNKGTVFILAQAVEAGWDQEALDSFLDSIR